MDITGEVHSEPKYEKHLTKMASFNECKRERTTLLRSQLFSVQLTSGLTTLVVSY